MNKLQFKFPFVILVLATSLCLADTSFTTNFTGGEGYTNGALDQSNQTGAAYFNEQFNSQLYLPGGQSPGFGTLKVNPTANGANAVYKNGYGADFVEGDSWTVSLDFTFEGLVNTAPGSANTLMQLGFSNSGTGISSNMYASIQKGSIQTESYQLVLFGENGGGFASQSFSYAAAGDDTADADDLTDLLRLEFTITESSTAGTYSTSANLFNLDVDSNTTIASAATDLTRSGTSDVDLYGYMKISMGNETDNFDLFQGDSFSYSTSSVPEPATYSFLLGGLALVVASMRRRKVWAK